MNRWAIAGCVAIGCAGVLAAEMTTADAGRGKSARSRFTKDIVVTLVTPTLNQEVLPDLADPGLNGRITVRFSSPPRRKDIIDNQNPVNRLTNKVEFLDSTFRQLSGEPTVRRNEFQFNPLDDEVKPVLPAGQYTLNIKSSLRNRRGRQLNQGLRDFTTTFSVGTDIHPPVLRRISPIHQQTNIGLRQPIRATFNEPIDPASLLATISVVDATTNPPTAILGTTTTQRNGFDVVFTPDPCFGYPPKTLIAFVMQGEDRPIIDPATGEIGPPTTSPVTDVFGNGFSRDPGLQWRNNPAIGQQYYESPNGIYDESAGIGTFNMIFETIGVKPAPQAVSPGSAMMTGTPIANPCTQAVFFAPACFATGSGIHYTTSNGLGQFSILGIWNLFLQGVTDLSAGSVLANAPVRVGRPTGMIVDRRWDPATLHTYMYMVDQRTQSVLVIDSRNFSVLGRFTGFVGPRDVAISTNTTNNVGILWTTDFASNQVVGIDLQRFAVTFSGQPGAASPCDAINDDSARRIFVDVGRGPTGVAAETMFNNTLITCNTLANSISLVSVTQGTVIQEYEVGSTPVDVDYVTVGYGARRMALVANQGGPNQPDGSLSLFAGGFGRDGIENTFSDQVKNPSSIFGHQEWINPFTGNTIPTGREWLVPNTGGDTILELGYSFTGGFGVAISASVTDTHEVGLNPTTAVYDPFIPANFIYVSVAGLGAIAGIDNGRPIDPELNPVPGVQRLFTAFSH